MAKRQKLSSIEFEDLPDELILEVLNNLDIKDIANCVRVSKRIRAICRDVSKFQTINLYYKYVPIGFIQLLMNMGCKYLSLNNAQIVWDNNNLRYHP